MQGNEREVVGKSNRHNSYAQSDIINPQGNGGIPDLTKGTSEWEGWGTALKPAHGPICMARKPLSEKTVAENCLKWGTGGINIDGCRVGTEQIEQGREGRQVANSTGYHDGLKPTERTMATGRFPANLIHDGSDEVRECFPESTSGARKAGFTNKETGYEASSYEIRVKWDKDAPAEKATPLVSSNQ